MSLVFVRAGDLMKEAVMWNADCDCDIFLDAVLRRAVKDTETLSKEREAHITETTLLSAEAIAKERQAVKDYLSLFEGLKEEADFRSVDLQDSTGKPMGLAEEPKARAIDVLDARQTYTLTKKDMVLNEKVGKDEIVLTPLTLEPIQDSSAPQNKNSVPGAAMTKKAQAQHSKSKKKR